MESRGRDIEDRQLGGQVKQTAFAQQDDLQAIQGTKNYTTKQQPSTKSIRLNGSNYNKIRTDKVWLGMV